MRFKSTLIIGSFFLLGVFVFLFAASHNEATKTGDTGEELAPVQKISEFSTVQYYLYKNEKQVLHLNADMLSRQGETGFKFIQPHGELYSSEEQIPLFFRADEGVYRGKSGMVEFRDNVQMSYEGAEFQAKILKYYANKNYFAAWGNVRSLIAEVESGDKLEIFSNEVQGWPSRKESLHKGNVKGKLLKKRKYQTGFDFGADVLRAKTMESLITMAGNVTMQKQRFNVRAGRAELFMKNFNKRLKYYVLYDDIRLVEELTLKDGSSLKRRAFAETLEGYNTEGRIVLTGAPRVEQGNDVIKGYKITLRENVEVVEVDDANSIFTIKNN